MTGQPFDRHRWPVLPTRAQRRTASQRDREDAVAAVAAGERVVDVAARLGVTRTAVYAWLRALRPEDATAREAERQRFVADCHRLRAEGQSTRQIAASLEAHRSRVLRALSQPAPDQPTG